MDNPVVELLQARIASRSIATTPLPDALIDELVEAVRLTPSCRNLQPWRCLFLRDPDGLERGRAALAAGNRPWAGRAPLLVYFTARRADDCTGADGRDYYTYDVGMAAMNLMLAATARGLTARPIAGFDPATVVRTFGLDAGQEPWVCVVVGYPSDDEEHLPERLRGANQRPRERKPAADIIRFA